MNNNTMTYNSYNILNLAINDISTDRLYHVEPFTGRKPARCACPNCTNACTPNDGSIRIITPSHHTGITICRYHANNTSGYSSENSIVVGRPTQDGITLSCELETSHNTNVSLAVMACDFQAMPSDDGSLDGDRPIEYKTPIYYSKQGFTKLIGAFESMLKLDYIGMDDTCGSHLHTGLCDNSIDFTQVFPDIDTYFKAFGALYEYLDNMPNVKMREYFGRGFVSYARTLRKTSDCYIMPRHDGNGKNTHDDIMLYGNQNLYGNGSYSCNVHRLAFNFQHSYSMEFRLPKFTSAKQYRKIAVVCMNMVIAIRDYHNGAILDNNYQLKPFGVNGVLTIDGLSKYFVALFKENYPY